MDNELIDLRVCDLMVPGSLCWDYEMLNELFCPRDVSEICNYPLSVRWTEDKYIWHFTIDGCYKVGSDSFEKS